MTTRSRAGQLVGDLPFPDISLPDISLADLGERMPHIRLPEVDVAELGDRLRELRDLPAVGSVTGTVRGSVDKARRSPLPRVALALAAVGAALGVVVAVRRLRGRKATPDYVAV